MVPRLALLWFCLPMSLQAQIVPAPQHQATRGPACRGLQIQCGERAFIPVLEAFVQALVRLGARQLEISAAVQGPAVLRIQKAALAGPESYRITPTEGALQVSAATPSGLARATATLCQVVTIDQGVPAWPGLQIEDQPGQSFRCIMVDLGRNPIRPAAVRHLVDAAWYYKLNYLHLHLSDDQLCSWPSKAFPKLHSKNSGWTRADFVALEAYSQARGITVIPEIDVPGHSTLLRRHYPEVFGKTPTDLASTREAQQGVETLIGELLEVFESTPYVHIGGDEAYGVPLETQRDFINRLNRFIKSKGRRTIVWEGPRLGEGDNKVATDVLHLNWRTVEFPAQQMLDAGYQVVNAAWDPMYIVDHYPRTMFTAVDLERCYAYDKRRFGHVDPGMPTLKQPHRATQDEGILGFCICYWEGREPNLLRLCVPRLAAIGAAAWNRAGEADFAGFVARQTTLLPRLQKLSGFELPPIPRADPRHHLKNLAYGAAVHASTGAAQPQFGPARLTNGIVERFDHFLGFPTHPEPLEIIVDLGRAQDVARILVHETAVGQSHEVYTLHISVDGNEYAEVGAAKKGTRGRKSYVEHRFARQKLRYIKILTRGCHGLTFPSFSRLTEILAFGD